MNVLPFKRNNAFGSANVSNLCLESSYEFSEFLDPDMIFEIPEMAYILEGVLCSLEHTENYATLRFFNFNCIVFVEKIDVKNCVYMKTEDYQFFINTLKNYCLERNYLDC